MVASHSNRYATFYRNERLIQQELIWAISERRIDLRAAELYNRANLSRQAFYLHYKNCDDVLRQLETSMISEFQKLSFASMNYPSLQMHKGLSLTVLMKFVSKHQAYFAANFRNRSFYLLSILINHLQSVLIPDNLDQRTYLSYVAVLEAVILYWGEYDNFSYARMPYYIDILQRIPIMGWPG